MAPLAPLATPIVSIPGKKLNKICPARWVESHASIVRFTELLELVFRALEKFSERR